MPWKKKAGEVPKNFLRIGGKKQLTSLNKFLKFARFTRPSFPKVILPVKTIEEKRLSDLLRYQ